MRVNGGIISRQRNNIWASSNSEKVSREIRSRQMLAETRGIQFESDTIVMRAKKSEAPKTASNELSSVDLGKRAHKGRGSQSKIGGYSQTKSKNCGGSSFFQKIVNEINDRDQSPTKKIGDWSLGISEKVPEKKKDSVERSLKWMEQHFEKDLSQPIDASETRKELGEAVKSDVFSDIRQRVANLLLHDLPH